MAMAAVGISINLNEFANYYVAVDIPNDKIVTLVREHFDLRPIGLITMLDLIRPIYQATAAYGHFGREEPEFTWERTDMADTLRDAAGI